MLTRARSKTNLNVALDAASLSMVQSAIGSVGKIETTPLLTMVEAAKAMQMAVYVPPGRLTLNKKKK